MAGANLDAQALKLRLRQRQLGRDDLANAALAPAQQRHQVPLRLLQARRQVALRAPCQHVPASSAHRMCGRCASHNGEHVL